jgi:hypothetical protein
MVCEGATFCQNAHGSSANLLCQKSAGTPFEKSCFALAHFPVTMNMGSLNTIPRVDVSMPIAVTCECGAKLEIDEKFLGKQILCPDCQRPLPTKAPVTPPPLDLPDYRRISGYALLSLTLALVGAFTIVGTIAAIVVGIYALKQIADKPSKLEGIKFARAGIAVGAFFTFLTLAALISPTLLGLDSFLREMAFAGRIQYPVGPTVEVDTIRLSIVLTRPSNRWASYIPPTVASNHFESSDLLMVNISEDAFIACKYVELDGGVDDAEEKLKIVLDKIYKSELVYLLGRLDGRPLGREAENVQKKVVNSKRGKEQEVTFDLRLGGIDRRFLVQYSLEKRDQLGVRVLVGAARRNRFDRLEDVFRKTFDSQKEKLGQ